MREGKKKVYVWGTGIYGRKALGAINIEKCEILGFIDNDQNKQGSEIEGHPVTSFHNISGNCDYIVVTVRNYVSVLHQIELEKVRLLSKVIAFYDEEYVDNPKYKEVIHSDKWRIALLEYKLKRMEEILEWRVGNLGYEIVDKLEKGHYWYPKMGDTKDAIDKIVNNGCSMIRFGDGEFQLMAGFDRPVFQRCEEKLSEGLKKAIQYKHDKLLIGIAKNYGELDEYAEHYADGIREYMSERVRNFHRSVLTDDRVYYDAYMFKCYLPYKDKESTEERFNLVKRIWEKRDVILIEGEYTRTGQGNDLLDNAKSVKRLLAPSKNAFSAYEQILQEALKLPKDALILMALGPAGKVLAIDLIEAGYQVVDIGQIDTSYECYKVGKGIEVPILNKNVSYMSHMQICEIDDKKYFNQIIGKIEAK